MNNFAPRLGFTWALDDAGTLGRARRLGHVLPEDAVHVPDRRGLGGRVSRIRSPCSFPANNVDAGPVGGPAADRSVPRQRPGREPRAAQLDVPGRARCRRTPAPCSSTIPIARCRIRARPASATSGSFGTAMAASVDYIRNDLKRSLSAPGSEPRRSRHHGAHGAVTRVESELHRVGPRDHQPWLGEFGFAAVQPGQALHARLSVSRGLHAVEDLRQHAVAWHHRH